jgi:hypothetical protein
MSLLRLIHRIGLKLILMLHWQIAIGLGHMLETEFQVGLSGPVSQDSV